MSKHIDVFGSRGFQQGTYKDGREKIPVVVSWTLRGKDDSCCKCCYCRSVSQSCPTLCNPMHRSTPGFPVLNCLPVFAQTQVHRVGDAIQPPHPLSPSSAPAFSLSQHQGLFQMSELFASGDQSIGASASASVFPMNIQG